MARSRLALLATASIIAACNRPSPEPAPSPAAPAGTNPVAAQAVVPAPEGAPGAVVATPVAAEAPAVTAPPVPPPNAPMPANAPAPVPARTPAAAPGPGPSPAPQAVPAPGPSTAAVVTPAPAPAPASSRTPAAPSKGPVTSVLKGPQGDVTLRHREHGDRLGCAPCHGEGTPGALALAKDKAHALCKGCHQSRSAGPVKCPDCHKKP